MKAVWRHPAAQRVLVVLASLYARLLSATLRWRVEGDLDAVLGREAGLIGLFWHGDIFTALPLLPRLAARRAHVLISRSPDGRMVASLAERLGIHVIAGSTERAAAGKGGAEAFRALIQALRAGEVVLITPDGPRGPARTLQGGCVRLAQTARTPVYGLGLSVSPCLRLNSWDGARIPLPFARAALHLVGPLPEGALASPDDLEARRQAWEAALRDASDRADRAAA